MARKFRLPFAAMFIILSAAICWGDSPVTVFLGEKPVDMKDTSPIVLSGHVYVPAKPFAEVLGANLDWDNESKTLSFCWPQDNSSQAVLTTAEDTSDIKATPVDYYNPYPQYSPYTPYPPYPTYPPYGYYQPFADPYGPILFFNDDFTQAWVWDPFNRNFTWIPIPGRYRPYGPPTIIWGPGRRTTTETQATPSPSPRTQPLTAEVVRVTPTAANPTITVSMGGGSVTYPVANDAVVLRGQVGGRALETTLGEVRAGDQVTLQFNSQGRVSMIRASYKVVSGRIRSVSQNSVTLDNGNILRVSPRAAVILHGNISGQLQDIRAGDTITARVSPVSGIAYMVRVMPAARTTQTSAQPQENPIRLNTTGPLRTGDTLIAVFSGKPGGRASFAISGVVENVSMTEVEPGIYDGRYIIQQGDVAVRQPVKVTFVASDGETYQTVSAYPITIQSVGIYLPRIISPRQGTVISSPIVVAGIAEPGATVRVSIEYRADLQRTLPIEGLSAIQDVTADQTGAWKTPPLPAVAPFVEDRSELPDVFGPVFSDIFDFPDEPPVMYDITAATIGPDGEEKASYTVEVAKEQPRRTVEGASPR